MADKKRLIDANEAIANTYEEVYCTESEQAWLRHFIIKQQTVDAVEVVRCKDCGKWDAKTGSCDEFTSHRLPTGGRIAFLTRESDFCSYGERRTDG